MIIIGDNMARDNLEKEVNLLDLGFNDFSLEKKREIFMILDIVMKKYHDHNYMITSFHPKDIYYQNDLYSFSKYTHISPLNSSDKNDAILNNIIDLSNLAFCSNLPMYDLNKGLLNREVVSKYYGQFENRFAPMDRAYYRSVLVDAVNLKKLPDIPYYYDYAKRIIDNNMDNSNKVSLFRKKEEVNSSSENGNVRAFVKATQAGKLMTDRDEAAFGTTFFITCMLATTLIAVSGILLYFLK